MGKRTCNTYQNQIQDKHKAQRAFDQCLKETTTNRNVSEIIKRENLRNNVKPSNNGQGRAESAYQKIGRQVVSVHQSLTTEVVNGPKKTHTSRRMYVCITEHSMCI